MLTYIKDKDDGVYYNNVKSCRVHTTVYCLSTDEKPMDLSNGSVCYEMDTQNVYMFDEEHQTWLKQ